MNLIDNMKLNFYPELKELKIDDEIKKKIISNTKFKAQYKQFIKPFIKTLKEYRYTDFIDGEFKEISLDNDTISQHLRCVFELSQNNNSNTYIKFINEKFLQNYKIDNFQVFNDSNFQTLYSLMGNKIFDNNICEIIKNGYSNRLLEFLNKNNNLNLNKINSSLFEDKVWNIISQNHKIGNTSLLELFNSRLEVLIDLAKNDFIEGLIYTYNNYPESHNFIEHQLGYRKDGVLSHQQFSMDFIQNIGDDTLKKLYERHKFSDEKEFKKIFEIASYDNYELIQDIVNYDKYDFNFKNIDSKDMQKKLLETDINFYNKNEVLLNKYFGIDRFDIHYIKLFLNAINKSNILPKEFQEKYGSILQLLNQILTLNADELLTISETLDSQKRDDYKKLIKSMEIDGNNILKAQFSSDLQSKNQQIVDNAVHKQISTNNGEIINVYELTGQPFTMLVHAIVDNRMSINNGYVSELVSNPEAWDKIDGGNAHISTSLISDKYMVTYGMPNNNETIMFGFNSVPGEAIKFTDIQDVGIDRKASLDTDYNMRNRITIADVNTITTVDDLMQKTIESNMRKQPNSRMWNEIGLSRIDESTGKKIMPNYIVCMDYISENSIKAANYYNIPIYIIHRQNYPQLPYVNDKDNDINEIQGSETSHLKR